MAGMRLLVHNALIIPVSDAGPARGSPAGSSSATTDGSRPSVRASPTRRWSRRSGLRLLDVGGAIVAPGFVSAHSHLFTSGMRGISPGSTLYPWVMSMVEVLDKCEPDDVYWSTLHGALDFLANGVTSAYNFMHPRVTWRYDPVTASPVLGRIAPWSSRRGRSTVPPTRGCG